MQARPEGHSGGKAAAEASASMHALGRLGEHEDIARLVVWLLDPQNDWITGQVFGADGGLATLRPRRPWGICSPRIASTSGRPCDE